jgi:hypothetical protein
VAGRILCKGFACVFEMTDGEYVRAPESAGLLHDPDGIALPKCHALITTFRTSTRTPSSVEYDGAPSAYLGRHYSAHIGGVTVPKGEWRAIRQVACIYYTRQGTRAPGRFRHRFGERRWQALWRKGELPMLYKLGSSYMLDLGEGAVWTDLGIVYP